MRERKDTGNQLFSCSDSGAIQISRDFNALREWIGASESVRPETRRYLLLLDSIRQCEGVAKLLRSRPGELVDVRPIKNKVSPITGNCYRISRKPKSRLKMRCIVVFSSDDDNDRRPDSPVNQILEAIPAELYVPDQQQWISLKANSRMLSLPFCCR